MPKAGIKEEYDLRKSFIGPFGDVYRSSESLEAWIRFTAGSPVDLGPFSLSVTEAGSSAYNLKTIAGLKDYYALEQQNNSQYIRAGDSSHWSSRLGITGNASSEYTISAWINPSTLSNSFGTIAKIGNYDIYFGRVLSSGQSYLYLQIDDTDSSTPRWRSTTAIPSGAWMHVAVTHDLSDLDANIPKFYFNGSEVSSAEYSSTGDNPFAGIEDIGLQVGSNSNLGNHDIAEVCVWSAMLSQEEIKVVHDSSVRDMHLPASGYLTNPVRTIIRENDHRTGSYPPISRTGDPDFKGNTSAHTVFDDTKTILFKGGFPRALISFNSPLSSIRGYRIGLTSSIGTVMRDFEFLQEEFDGAQTRVPVNGIAVSLNNLNTINTSAEKFDGPHIAHVFSNLVNKETSLGIRATRVGNRVELKRYDEPQGVYPSNLIALNAINVRDNSVKPIVDRHITIRQFSADKQVVNAVTKLGLNSPFRKTNISKPNALPDLEVTGAVVAGLSDLGVHFSPGENLKPFDDSRITLRSDSFFNQGTPPSILKGFSEPLKSKTQLVFRLKSSNEEGTHIYYSSGSPGPAGTNHPSIAGKAGSGMAYWNDILNRWEMLPYSFNPRSLAASTRVKGVRGFTTIDGQTYNIFPGDSETDANNVVKNYKSVGHPTPTSAFPMGQQYNATGSQEIKMSEYISSPFLLEKISVEFKGNLGVEGLHNQTNLRERKFFVLAQKTDGDVPHVHGQQTIKYRDNSSTPATGENTAVTKGLREVVGYGRIFLARTDWNAFSRASSDVVDDFEDSVSKILRIDTDDTTARGITGSFGFGFSPKLSLNSDTQGLFSVSDAANKFGLTQYVVDQNVLGGASLDGRPSGRQLAQPLDVADIDPEGNTQTIANPQSLIRHRSEYFRESPYLLMPEDSIIFGWDNHTDARFGMSQTTADEIVDRLSDLKVTFYGSLIRNGHRHHEGTNQPLTSEAIHENILGSPVVDQWDVEPVESLSGSNYDALLTGFFLSTGSEQRGRRGSIAAGHAGQTGSLDRNIKFFNDNAKFKDSLMPSVGVFISDIAPQATASVITCGGVQYDTALIFSTEPTNPLRKILEVGNVFGNESIRNSATVDPSTMPLLSPQGGQSYFPGADKLVIGANLITDAGSARIFSGSRTNATGIGAFTSTTEVIKLPDSNPMNLADIGPMPLDHGAVAGQLLDMQAERQRNLENARALANMVFTVPYFDFFRGFRLFPAELAGGGVCDGPIGFKYGILNTAATSPMYHFRRGSFGQIRDLMESPPEARLEGLVDLADEDNGVLAVDQDSKNSPVKIVFMSRNGDSHISPLDTNSQNLSNFATSSIPFVDDGISHERDTVNDPPPDMTDVTTIEEAVAEEIDGAP